MALARPAARIFEGRRSSPDMGKETRLRLVPSPERERPQADGTSLERKIKEIGKDLEILYNKGFATEAFELGDDLLRVEQAKDQLGKLDLDDLRVRIADLHLELDTLKGDVEHILREQVILSAGGEDDFEEETTAVEGPKEEVTAVDIPVDEFEDERTAVNGPKDEDEITVVNRAKEAPRAGSRVAPEVGNRSADTAVIRIDRLRGPKKRDFEPRPGAAIDIPESLVREMVRESGEKNNLIRAIVSGDQGMARTICHDLLDTRGTVSGEGAQTELETKLERVLAPQGITMEQFYDRWKGGLYEALLKVIQERVDAEVRKQAVADISTVDKVKVNWKGIAKKAIVVGGLTAAAATGFGLVLGGAAAVGAGVAAGGVLSRFFQGFTKKRREEGVENADEKEAQSKMNALIEAKKGKIVEKLIADWESDVTSMSLVLSQGIREASAGDTKINQKIVQEVLFQAADHFKAEGEVDEAQARELEGLIVGLGNLRETDPELKKLLAEAESTPVAIEILKKLQEAKSGQLFAVTKGEKNKSKIENVAGYLAPVAVGAAVGLAYTSGVAVGARVGMGAFGMGVTGYKMGEARDRSAKEKQVEAAVARMVTEADKVIKNYENDTRTNEFDGETNLRESVSKLKAQVEMLSTLQPDAPKSILLTKAEAVIREGDRILLEARTAKTLLDELKMQREAIIDHAGAGIKKVNKDVGKWRRWVGLGVGAVVGGGIGFLGGELAEHRQEVKMEEKLDALLHDVPADVKERALQSFAAPGHQVHDVEDLTFAELKNLSVGDGKALDVGLIQLKLTEAQGQEDLLHNYGLKPTELDSLSLHDRVSALQDMTKTFGGWERQGMDKDAIAVIGATGHGAKGPEADTVNNLLAWDKAQGGNSAVMRVLNRGLTEPEADVTKVLENAVRLKDSITGWEKSGLSADSIEAITHDGGRTAGMVDQLLEKSGNNRTIIAKLINNGLGKEGADVGDVLKDVDEVGRRVTSWTERGLSARAIEAIDTASSGGIAGKMTTIDRLLAGAGGDTDVMRTINSQLEGGVDVETALKNALVAQGRGVNSVTALIAHQLEANPNHYGFDAQKRFTDATEWANHEAARLAIKGGYINKDGTSHLGVILQGKKDNFVLLTEDEEGHLGIKVTGKTYIMDESNTPAQHAAEMLPAAKTARVNIRSLSGTLTEGDSKAGNAVDIAQARADRVHGSRGRAKAA